MKTTVFQYFDERHPPSCPCVLAIGNFDGVHRGHQGVIAAAIEKGRETGLPGYALTFEPHPRSFFAPAEPLFRLTPLEEKLVLFRLLDLDGAVMKNFDAALASLEPDEFVEFLAHRFHAAHLVTGANFHFGKNRAGTPSILQQEAKKRGMSATFAPAQNEGGLLISSSQIRTLLRNGDIEKAGLLLGYRFFVTGKVVHGDKRGQALGYPTANLTMPPGFALKHGVYAARARAEGTWYGAAVHFGTRVQFGDGSPLMEAHVLDFSGDLYGKTLRLEFLAFLRAEQKFPNVEQMVGQMDQDVDKARGVIAQVIRQPVTELQRRLEALEV